MDWPDNWHWFSKEEVKRMKKKITLVVLDIDGVLTDGKVVIDDHGKEYKAINYRDLDSINYLKNKGVEFALLTGENTDFVNIIAKRFKIKNVIKGAKDKAAGLLRVSKMMNTPAKNICYVGDSDRDAEGLKISGVSFVPKDATKKAKKSATYVFSLKGGEGIVQALKERLLKDAYILGK